MADRLRAPVGVALLFIIAAASPRVDAAPYSLAQLVQRVTVSSPNAAAAREALAAAREQLRQAQYLWLPTGDVNLGVVGAPDVHCTLDAQGNRLDDCISTNLTDLGNNNVPLSQRLPVHNALISFNVSIIQPLYTFGKIEAAIGLGEGAVGAADGTLRRDRADLVVAAVRTYWGLKAARAQIAILEAGLAQLQRWLSHLEHQLDGNNSGGYTEADVARLKLALVNLRGQLSDQRRSALALREGLRAVVADPEADVDDAELALIDGEPLATLGEWEARATQLRPELTLMRAGLDALRAYGRLRLAEMLPDIGLASGLIYGSNTLAQIDRPPNGYIPQPAGAFGGSFSLVVREHLDIGAGLGRIDQLRLDLSANRARAEQALGGISIEVAKGWADYEEGRSRVQTTARAEGVARGWLASVDENMAVGLHQDLRQLSEAFRYWIDFSLRHVQALADANVAYAALRRATDLDFSDPAKLASAVGGSVR